MKVLIRGAGEHATGTAHRLARCGFQVALTDIPQPTLVRRHVSFGSAVVLGEVTVEGVRAVRREPGEPVDGVSVYVDPDFSLLHRWGPQVVVDARILKRNDGNRLDLAPLVIGLGPGIQAGVHAHVVVETQRGHHLGRLLYQGQAQADTGVPGQIGGHDVHRVLRAPVDGTVQIVRDIGAQVEPGDLVCRVSPSPGEAAVEVRAAIAGVVRGLVFEGTPASAGLKIGDVDPRGDREACHTLSDKTRTLSGAVLEAILHHFGGRP